MGRQKDSLSVTDNLLMENELVPDWQTEYREGYEKIMEAIAKLPEKRHPVLG